MRVLITGHDGYIGTVLVPKMVREGFDVVGLDSFLFSDCRISEDHCEIPAVRKDIRDLAVEDFEGFDAVVHMAGLSNDPLGDFQPKITLDINYRAAVKTAELAKQAGVSRFVFSSTCSVYGAAGQDMVDEQSDTNPVTPYAQAKLLAEQDMAKLASDDFCPVFLRHATAYGVSPRVRFDLAVNNLVAWAVATKQVLLKSDGMPWRPLVHVQDISRAFIAALNAPVETVWKQAINVGRTDQNFRIKEVAETVAAIVPDCTVAFEAAAGPDKRTYRVNCDKFADMFGNDHIRWPLEKGVHELYHGLKDSEIQPEEFEGPRYARLPYLQHLVDIGRVDRSFRHVSRRSAAESQPAQSI